MELNKRQEGTASKEKDESWNFQRSKREPSIQPLWNLNRVGCTTPAGLHKNPRLEKLNTYYMAKNKEWLWKPKVVRECKQQKLKKRDCFLWGNTESINKK